MSTHERAHARRRWTLDDIERFARPVYFGFTSSQVLMGVAAVTVWPGWGTLAAVLMVAASFHVFAYVQNDVLDLPIDRTQPLRANDPLVSGRISPRAAMTLAIMQVPLAFLVTWWVGGGIWSYVTLTVGFVFMTLYNLYGKRCPIPMITDAVQGISWATLAVYGSLTASGHVNSLTFIAASFGFGFLFVINGIHGGLRDLRNDLKLGCRTTAIFFGARPDDEGGVRSTLAVRVYALFALSVYLTPATVALIANRFGFSPAALSPLLLAWALLCVASVYGLWLITEPTIRNRKEIIGYQTLPMLLAPVVIFLPKMDTPLIATTLVCFFLPFPIFDPFTRGWISSLVRPQKKTRDGVENPGSD